MNFILPVCFQKKLWTTSNLTKSLNVFLFSKKETTFQLYKFKFKAQKMNSSMKMKSNICVAKLILPETRLTIQKFGMPIAKWVKTINTWGGYFNTKVFQQRYLCQMENSKHFNDEMQCIFFQSKWISIQKWNGIFFWWKWSSEICNKLVWRYVWRHIKMFTSWVMSIFITGSDLVIQLDGEKEKVILWTG